MAGMTAAEEAARAWVDSVNGGAGGLFNHWRASLLSKTLSASGRERPLRVRRFAEGCPASCMKEALEYLLSLAPYSGVAFNGQPVSGRYRPTLTYWKRDAGEAVNGRERPDCTYTLVQDLVDADAEDSESASTGLSCTEAVETAWHWDDAAPGEVPSTGAEQGVTYAVTGVARSEDGTFSWSLVKRTALTQVGEWALSAEDAYHETWTRSYDNLYGEPGAFRDSDGNAVSVPSPGGTAHGTLVERTVAPNPDCTYRVSVTKRVAKSPVAAGRTDARTAFGRDTSERTSAASKALGDAPAAAGGVTWTHKSDRRQDGLWDVERQARREETVPVAELTRERTLRGVVETVRSRSVVDSSAEVPALGDRVSVALTQGGLWDRTVTRALPEAAGDVGSQCAKTVFEHVHAATTNESARPGAEAGEAGGGVTRETSARATEAGTWDVTRRTTTEVPRPGASVTRTRTVRGVVTVTEDRSSSNSSASVSRVGDEVRVELTPGGLWNRRTTRVEASPADGIAEECRATALVHLHSVTDAVASRPPVEAEADVNVDRSVTARLTNEGAWDRETQTVTYDPFGPAVAADVAGPASRTVLKVYRNLPAPCATEPPGRNFDVSVSASLNDHGSYDGTVRETEYYEARTVATSRWATETATTTHLRHGLDFEPSAAMGEASGTPDDAGGATSVVTEYEPHPIDSGWLEWDSTTVQRNGTYKYHHGVRIFKNLAQVPTPPRGSNSGVSVSINKFGLFDGTLSYDDLYAWEEGGSGGSGGSHAVFALIKAFTAGGYIETVASAEGRIFYGTGNDGAYASACENCVTGPGLPRLSGRVVWYSYDVPAKTGPGVKG